VKPVRTAFILILILLPPWRAFAADDFATQYYDLREKEIRQFSGELFTAAEYYRAITEARRYLSLFPKGPRAGEMAKMIGDAYLLSHEWADAIAAYDDFLGQFPDSPLANAATFYKAIALIKQGSTAEAERLFQLILGSPDRTKKGEAARWEILLLIRQNRFDEAERLLRDRMIRPEVEAEASLIEGLLMDKKEARYKSPATAGLLSAILPGSGQL
jgi:tetratricopeptide (TPR) repeat protein